MNLRARTLVSAVVFSALGALPGLAGAQNTARDAGQDAGQDASQRGTMNPDARAPMQIVRAEADGIRYQSGGIGSDEVQRMRQDQGRYNVHLVMSAGPSDDYIADVPVRIMTSAGKPVFTLQQAGPLLDLRLPAGSYQVVAEYAEGQRSASFDVQPGERANVYLHFPRENNGQS